MPSTLLSIINRHKPAKYTPLTAAHTLSSVSLSQNGKQRFGLFGTPSSHTLFSKLYAALQIYGVHFNEMNKYISNLCMCRDVTVETVLDTFLMKLG